MSNIKPWRAVLLGLGPLLLTGCMGEANWVGPNAREPGTGDTPSWSDPAPDDEAMRATDPALFAVAARYFPGEKAVAPKRRLFRLTRRQLDLTADALFPPPRAVSAETLLPSDPLQTNYEFADNLGFSGANFTPFRKWLDGLTAPVRLAPRSVIDCSAQANAEACLEQQARAFATRAFRGVASEERLAALSAFYVSSVREVGLAEATADLVDVTLSSPSFAFREEVHTGADELLLPPQRLQALTYTLADVPPEGLSLRSLDATSLLGTPDETARTVERVLESPAASAKLARFFMAWLEVKDADAFTLSTEVFPEFTPGLASAMIDETRRYLEHHLGAQTPTLSALTQSTDSFVSSETAGLYGLPKTSITPLTKVTLDPTQRLGLFTQPAVIASHSGPSTTRLVKRGVFFTRKVMCLPLGNVPPGVDTSLPEDTTSTERQRVENATRPPNCTGCHGYINPFGFMQENYDPLGRWRTVDNGQPIDASISVGFLDEGALQARTPIEALSAFTRSLRFQQCFVRQLFRFYTGRTEEPGDDPLLRKLFYEFARNDAQDLKALLRGLATAPSYTARGDAR